MAVNPRLFGNKPSQAYYIYPPRVVDNRSGFNRGSIVLETADSNEAVRLVSQFDVIVWTRISAHDDAQGK